MSKSSLVVIDNSIHDYTTIISALNIHTKYILLDRLIDTYDTLKIKITELNVSAFSSVGIIQHNMGGSTYSLFRNGVKASTLVNVSESDPNLDSWTDYQNFITYLKDKYSIENFDLMACALYSNTNWKYVIDTLETRTGVNIRGSKDDTGSAQLGGNWFLETDSVNLKDVYFTDAIDEFKWVLNTGRVLHVRNEGTNSTSGIVGSPSIIVGFSFYENYPNDIYINIETHARLEGISGVYTSDSYITNFSPIQTYSSYRVRSLGINSCSIDNLTYTAPQPLSNLPNALISNSQDDSFINLDIPWNVTYLGTSYASTFLSSNTYLSFGQGSAVYASLSASNPAVPKIFVGSADNSWQRVNTVLTTGDPGNASVPPNLSNFTISTRNFNDSAFTITAPTSNSGGSFSYTSSNTSVASISGTTLTIVGAGSTTITAFQAASGNYTSGSTSTTFTVNPATITGTNNNVSIPFNGSQQTVTVISNLSPGGATYSGSVTVTETNVGTYNTTITGYTNYTGSVTGTLTIYAIAPSFNPFSAITKTFGETAFTVSASSNSGGGITYISNNTGIATISGTTVSIVGAGSTTITANQDASGNYTSGSISTSLTVNQATITGTNNNVSTPFNGSSQTVTVISNVSPGGATYSGSLTVTGTNVGTYNTTITGYTNYTGSVTGTLTIYAIAPSLSNFTIPTKNFGDATFFITAPNTNSGGVFTYTSSDTSVATINSGSDIFNSEAVTLTSARTAIHNLIGQNLKLLYQYVGTSINANAFHTACDNQGPTLTVVKASNGAIALAYSSVSWDSDNIYRSAVSGSCWLCPFQTSEVSTTINTARYYNSIAPQNSIVGPPSYGPTFGGGHDLLIASSCYTSPSSYEAPPNGLFNNGSGYQPFTLWLVEVYRLGGSNSITILKAGLTTITATQASSGNYTSGSTSTTLTIQQATITGTNSNISLPFNGSQQTVTVISNLSPSNATYNGSLTVTGTNVGTYNTTITGYTNYTGSVTGTLTIYAIAPSFNTFSAITKTFGETAFTVSASSNSGGGITYGSSNTSVATVSGTTVTIVGAGSTTITANQAASGNYTSGSTSTSLTVNQATINGTNNNVSIPFNGSSQTVTVISNLSPSNATYNGSLTVSGTNIGTYSSTITGHTNYTGSVTGTLTIYAIAPSFNPFSAITKTFGDGTFTVSASSNSGGGFTYTSSNPSVATISGTTVTIVAAGSTTITAAQAGSGNYTSGSTSTTLTVNPATINGTNNNVSVPYNGSSQTATVISNVSPGGATYSGSLNVSGTNVGTYNTTITGYTNYTGTVTGTLTIYAIAPSLSNFTLPIKNFRDPDFSLIAPNTNSGGSFTYVSSNTSVANVSGSTVTIYNVGSTTITATQSASGNYTSGSIGATLTVIPLHLYTFTGHTFTNASATGRTGPTLSAVRTAYSGASWAQDTTNNYLDMTTQGIQLWTVPQTGSYTFRAIGAGSEFANSNGGQGVDITTTVNLTKGEVIKILVGQKGGGGGATYAVKNNGTPIIVAGGGGAAYNSTTFVNTIPLSNATTNNAGNNSFFYE